MRTCSGLKPKPSSRPGMRRSTGSQSSSLTVNGALGRVVAGEDEGTLVHV